ncbi:MAG TPA: hypothetical protein VN851_09225 [Thermoanaerobaculia bacterium]|nr:hypothetical protein [Thermoanaerobaculia bacterium]
MPIGGGVLIFRGLWCGLRRLAALCTSAVEVYRFRRRRPRFAQRTLEQVENSLVDQGLDALKPGRQMAFGIVRSLGGFAGKQRDLPAGPTFLGSNRSRNAREHLRKKIFVSDSEHVENPEKLGERQALSVPAKVRGKPSVLADPAVDLAGSVP